MVLNVIKAHILIHFVITIFMLNLVKLIYGMGFGLKYDKESHTSCIKFWLLGKLVK